MESQALDKKGILKAMFFAILIAFLGIGILGWQYHQIEKKQIPALEEKIEQRAIEDVLDKFMQLRIEGGNEEQLRYYLTEGAVAQDLAERLALPEDFESYEIIQTEKMTENKYRYAVKIYRQEGLIDFVEVITLIKILDRYYIDSVEMAG